MNGMSGIFLEFSAATVGVVVAAVLVTGWVLVLWRRRDLTARRLLLAGVTSCYLAGVAMVTVPLQVRTGDFGNLIPWYERAHLVPLAGLDTTTVVLNIVMTVPAGVLLPLLVEVRGVGQVARTGLALSAVIESMQFVTDVLISGGRTADVNDLAANTLGAVLGYLLYRALTRVPVIACLAAGGRPGTPAPSRTTTSRDAESSIVPDRHRSGAATAPGL
ncbi:VanZ family protein [Actinoplanes italicus]|nr:VanZ family protein [Actinoplanes italicus]